MTSDLSVKQGLRVAIEGCGHGTLNSIYASIKKSCELKGWDGVDLLIIGGDFQAVRNAEDMNTISMPVKYRELGDFHDYYSGRRVAPYLTIFVGGNHEASNYLWELHYGGWAAPNIFYMGAANVIRVGPLRIAGLSGIWKGYDYKKPHHERLPYNKDDVKSIYHVREIDVTKLLQLQTQVDIGISHDWPRAIEWNGNWKQLFRKKKDFEEESKAGTLGSQAARFVIDRLRPAYWFSAHMHIKFAATVDWDKKDDGHKLSSGKPSKVDDEILSPADTSLNGESSNLHANGETHDGEALAKNEEEIDLDLDDEDEQRLVQQPEDYHAHEAAIHLPVGDDSETVPIASSLDSASGNQSASKNEDEIDLDLDEDDQSDSKKRKRTDAEDETNGEEARPAAQDVGQPEETSESSSAPVAETCEPSRNGEHAATNDAVSVVSEDLRAQLPAAFSRPVVRESATIAADLPPPPGITNKKTYFLALDKCLPNRDFLQILEIDAISEPISQPFEAASAIESSEQSHKQPIILSYDKEWLAIMRVFAAEQPPNTSPFATLPPKRDASYYLPLIAEQEAWVTQNIPSLIIPQNFIVTAPVHDPAASVHADAMPREYPNPQTEAFCQLLQIPNHFTATEDEIQARMSAGPKPATEKSGRGGFPRGRGGGGRGGHLQHQGHGGHRSGRGGNKGRGDRGRGGHGHGWGNRGRGNPNHSALGRRGGSS